MWNDLSMKDKAAIIALGVKSGVTDLDNIRNGYNNYEGYYNSNPNIAQNILKEDTRPTVFSSVTVPSSTLTT